MPSKTLKTTFSPRERYAIWFHISRNINAANRREQDQIDDLYTTLDLSFFDAESRAARLTQKAIEPDDYDATIDEHDGVELARDELSYLLTILGRPMTAALSRLTLPIARRLEKQRDAEGVNAPACE